MAQESKEIIYVGTFSENDSKGIYVMEFDRNTLNFKEIQTIHDRKSPSFITIHPNKKYLYAAYREGTGNQDPNGTIIAYAIKSDSGELEKINEVSSRGAGPCHISVDPAGSTVFVSHYQGGNLASFKTLDNGGISEAASFIQHEGGSKHPERQAGPHMHSMIPSRDGQFVYASDLGLDKIMVYRLNPSESTLSLATPSYAGSAAGAGPRHFVIHPHLPYAYSVEELSNTVAIFKVDPESGALSPLDRVNMLSDQVRTDFNAAADIHISKNGKWLYASNRGQNNLAYYAINNSDGALTLKGHVDSGGEHPRNFKIDDMGEFVFVANMNSDNVVVFSHDPQTGMLTPTGKSIHIPRAVCIEQLSLDR
jgi:6-phosphogluconolactonase